MARERGLEPLTLGSEDRCSIQLSYSRTLKQRQNYTQYIDNRQSIWHNFCTFTKTCTGSSAVEQETLNLLAVGSIPTRCTMKTLQLAWSFFVEY
jgi:hypothetical protein